MQTLYVGNQADPEERTKISVSDLDARKVTGYVAKPFRVTVLDRLTDKYVTLADEDCGAGCRCALRFVRKNAKLGGR